MPWADSGFNRDAVKQQAAQDQIVNYTAQEIMQLNEQDDEEE